MALLPGSPAIDAGHNSGAPATDQRGVSRVGTVDIGAFESRGFSATVAGGDNQSTPVNTAFAQPLVVSVASAHGEPVVGGQVTFTAPASGASAVLSGTPATIDADGTASVTATANNVPGSYAVDANAAGLAEAVHFSLTNLNRPPVAEAGGPYTVSEGGTVQLNASASMDFDEPSDTLIYDWDFDGDDLYDDATGVDPTFSAALLDGPRSVTVRLRVTDSYGESSTDSATIQVDNVAPEVVPPAGSLRVQEGAVFELPPFTFTDPGIEDSHTATIDWGDGSPVEDGTVVPPSGGEPGRITGSHVYGDNGTYKVTVSVRDDDMTDPDPWVESFFDVFVDNVLPSNVQVQLSASAIGRSDTLTLSGTFVDPGILDTHRVTVYWGDGNSSTVDLAANVYGFSTSHLYLESLPGNAPREFPISVSVIDKDFLPPVSGPPSVSNFQFGQLSWYDAAPRRQSSRIQAGARSLRTWSAIRTKRCI
jgi:hypothetical protein